jgi:hypothetical protein
MEEHRLKVLENRAVGRTFGLKGNELMGGWRNLHDEELLNLYFSPSVIKIIKSRSIRLAGNMARIGGDDECT